MNTPNSNDSRPSTSGVIKLAEKVIWNTGPALGLDDRDIQKIIDGRDSWQIKGLVESAIVAVLEAPAQDIVGELKAKVTGMKSDWERDAFEAFLQEFTENILWFDACAPRPKGFYRHQSWLYLKGGYTTVRVLSWLKREAGRLEDSQQEKEAQP